MILDRDSKFDDEVITFLKATGLQPKRTSVRAPWQNGIAARWVGSCRREILNHVIALNEQHLRRLIRDYVKYHHEDRTHDSRASGVLVSYYGEVNVKGRVYGKPVQ